MTTHDPSLGPESPPPPREATTEEKAMYMWEAMGMMLQALTLSADTTKAKNYVAVIIDGLRAPFDRAELHLIRPGGKTPTERIERMLARIKEAHALPGATIKDLVSSLRVEGFEL